jgi:hypothetical protein
MDLALAGSALLMGLAGSPHCLAMCGASCTALTGGVHGRPQDQLSFQLARLLSYAAGGAVVAASVNLLAQWGQGAAVLRPLWVLIHLAALLLGLTLLWRGRQPAWLENLGGAMARQVSVPAAALAGGGIAFSRSARPTRAALAGLFWVAWPCGLLQSALVVAALASGPLPGAGVMAAFALGSGLGLALGPLLLGRLLGGGQQGMRWSIRLAGLGLAAASIFALGHGVWAQIAAFCS